MIIGIVAAMEEEAVALIEQMENKRKTTHARQRFYRGTIGNQKLVLVQSGIGKVNAALATTLLIDHYKVDQVINSGVAGGIGEQLAVGDLVISTECAYHDADNRVFGYEYGQIPQMPVCYPSSEQMIEKMNQIAQKDWTVHFGQIVTGDSFIASQRSIDRILSYFPHALATEMEGAAVAQICYQFEIPFIIIRAISDVGDEQAEQSYETFVEETGRKSADMLVDYLKH